MIPSTARAEKMGAEDEHLTLRWIQTHKSARERYIHIAGMDIVVIKRRCIVAEGR
jgi:hypothetical protein